MSFCKRLEKNYARANSTLPKIEKPARKVGGEAVNFWCASVEFWRGGTRSRMNVPRGLRTQATIIVSYENMPAVEMVCFGTTAGRND